MREASETVHRKTEKVNSLAPDFRISKRPCDRDLEIVRQWTEDSRAWRYGTDATNQFDLACSRPRSDPSCNCCACCVGRDHTEGFRDSRCYRDGFLGRRPLSIDEEENDTATRPSEGSPCLEPPQTFICRIDYVPQAGWRPVAYSGWRVASSVGWLDSTYWVCRCADRVTL